MAYVFIHFLPELAVGERGVGRVAGDAAFAERHVYLIALAGLLVLLRPRPAGQDFPLAP